MPWPHAPLPLPLADSVRYPPGRVQAVRPGLLRFCVPSKFRSPLLHDMFRPSVRSMDLLCPLLTSACLSTRSMSRLGLWRTEQTSPGNAHSPSHLYPPHIRPCFPYRYGALKIMAFSPSTTASYAIPVRRASALPAASFRFHLAMDTLAVRLTVPPIRPVRDLHPQVNAPCRAHHKKRRACLATFSPHVSAIITVSALPC